MVGGGSYQNKPFDGVDTRYDGVASFRHEPSGLNVTAGATNEKMTRGATATSWIVKVGWLTDLVPLGKTAFSADFYRVSDLRVDGDRGTSYWFLCHAEVAGIRARLLRRCPALRGDGDRP